MDILETLQQLIDDVLHMQWIEQSCSNNLFRYIVNEYNGYSMEISFHIIEYHVEILVIVGFEYFLQFDNIVMVRQLFQEDDFSKCSLGIS